MQKHLNEINKKIMDIKDDIDLFDACIAEHTNDIARLISVTPKTDQYQKLPQKLVPSLPQFIPNTIQDETLSYQLGSISPFSFISEEYGYIFKPRQEMQKAGSSRLTKTKSPDVVFHQVYIDIFHLTNNPQNISCLGDDKLWICDESNIIELYVVKDHIQDRFIKTKARTIPEDIAVLRSEDLVYTDGLYKTINIVKNDEIQELIRLQYWKPRYVCSTFSVDILVTMGSDDNKQTKVVRYTDFTENQTIQFDDEGKPLYSSGGPRRYMNICENRNLDVCVADYHAKAIVVVNRAGKLRFRYIGHTPAPRNKPFCPQGITTDSESHILTTDYDNRCVHIIDKDGQFLHYLILGKNKPYRICIDNVDNLFVISKEKDKERDEWYCTHSCVMKIKYMW
ncbi:uncharacterized protein LOC134276846 [Saccostrea cucullata]|uniref:uncharacterized protein LOC134276846 n=1 Tax=Saccostrea cuccullata TaxID=36930 RepID=UPI002ED213DC